eukprot:TRINITY_DN5898_c0_g1_i5.p1 TRINITY_DN5898_c0_g1~~TRINITY_DN5898_c0_g1_i5.p1  ORF type:complete len:222 (-),score=4.89 TRINITY_DN5898_c0_g1_i5:542-1207(-)
MMRAILAFALFTCSFAEYVIYRITTDSSCAASFQSLTIKKPEVGLSPCTGYNNPFYGTVYEYTYCENGLLMRGSYCDSSCTTCQVSFQQEFCNPYSDGTYRGYICPDEVTPSLIGFTAASALKLTAASSVPDMCEDWTQADMIFDTNTAFPCQGNTKTSCQGDDFNAKTYSQSGCSGSVVADYNLYSGCDYPAMYSSDWISCSFEAVFPPPTPVTTQELTT